MIKDWKVFKNICEYIDLGTSSISTSMIIKFSEDNNCYYFETLHTIYKTKKENLYKVGYRDQLEELKAYLQCEDFRQSLEKFTEPLF